MSLGNTCRLEKPKSQVRYQNQPVTGDGQPWEPAFVRHSLYSEYITSHVPRSKRLLSC